MTYTDRNGLQQTIKGSDLSVVVASDETGTLEKKDTYAQYSTDNTDKEHIINTILVQRDDRLTNPIQKADRAIEFTHELGHFLGHISHPGGFENSDQGITSRDHRNVRLTPDDVPEMIQTVPKIGRKAIGGVIKDIQVGTPGESGTKK
ncbi:MAG: hypothetical protein JSS82_10645 [Bacteroidetes bacterium]|nr:hypothetical protein [Bacteroidota bacterium]